MATKWRPPTRNPNRQRGREFFTLLLAVSLALFVGRQFVAFTGHPPFGLILLVFLFAYLVVHMAIWRASETLFRR